MELKEMTAHVTQPPEVRDLSEMIVSRCEPLAYFNSDNRSGISAKT